VSRPAAIPGFSRIMAVADHHAVQNDPKDSVNCAIAASMESIQRNIDGARVAVPDRMGRSIDVQSKRWPPNSGAP